MAIIHSNDPTQIAKILREIADSLEQGRLTGTPDFRVFAEDRRVPISTTLRTPVLGHRAYVLTMPEGPGITDWLTYQLQGPPRP